MKFLVLLFFCILFSPMSHSVQDNPGHQVQKPKLKVDELAVYFKETYHIFKVVQYNNLKLSENCFAKSTKPKKAKPKCQAFEVAQIKVRDVVSTAPGQTHYASMHCTRLMGQNLIAYDHQKNEYDYCRFPDDSLVSSWSMFNNAFQRAKK